MDAGTQVPVDLQDGVSEIFNCHPVAAPARSSSSSASTDLPPHLVSANVPICYSRLTAVIALITPLSPTTPRSLSPRLRCTPAVMSASPHSSL